MLLPMAERRGEIHFYFAKSLPYTVRLALAFFLMAAGLVVETVFLDSMFWVGLPIVLVGMSLLLAKGYENKVGRVVPSAEWRPARRAEVERIITLNKKQKKWDQAAIDITCVRGFFALFLVLVLAGGATAVAITVSPRLGPVVTSNVAVMLLPFWVTGVRSILKNDRLVVKSEMLLAIEDLFNQAKKPGEEFQYQIQTAETSGRAGQVPQDVKALVLFHEGPPEFLGLQMQISINSVQGTDYPYFYCVLVAKQEFGSFEGRLTERPRKVVVEPEFDAGVYIAVIRQATTPKSGYHTNLGAASSLFAYALDQARLVTTEGRRA